MESIDVSPLSLTWSFFFSSFTINSMGFRKTKENVSAKTNHRVLPGVSIVSIWAVRQGQGGGREEEEAGKERKEAGAEERTEKRPERLGTEESKSITQNQPVATSLSTTAMWSEFTCPQTVKSLYRSWLPQCQTSTSQLRPYQLDKGDGIVITEWVY